MTKKILAAMAVLLVAAAAVAQNTTPFLTDRGTDVKDCGIVALFECGRSE